MNLLLLEQKRRMAPEKSGKERESMADKDQNNKRVTAEELLSRLSGAGREKSQNPETRSADAYGYVDWSEPHNATADTEDISLQSDNSDNGSVSEPYDDMYGSGYPDSSSEISGTHSENEEIPESGGFGFDSFKDLSADDVDLDAALQREMVENSIDETSVSEGFDPETPGVYSDVPTEPSEDNDYYGEAEQQPDDHDVNGSDPQVNDDGTYAQYGGQEPWDDAEFAEDSAYSEDNGEPDGTDEGVYAGEDTAEPVEEENGGGVGYADGSDGAYDDYDDYNDYGDYEEYIDSEHGQSEPEPDFDGSAQTDGPEADGNASDGEDADETALHDEQIGGEEIIPDDDFFDQDPISDEEEYSDSEEPEQDGEVNEEKDFENLVAQVTGGGDAGDLDESDISLMVALGMEDELAKTVGADAAAQITDDYMADQEEWVDKTKRFGPDEYSSPSENIGIAEKYKKRNRWALGRMLLNIALAVILLVYENISLLGYQFSGALDPAVYPVVYVMVDLQILLIMAAAAYRHVLGGFKDLFSLKPTSDSFSSVMTLAAVGVSIYTAYASMPGVEPRMFNLPAALCLLFSTVNEYLTVRREIFSFNVVSSAKPKYVMRRLSTRDSVMESEAVADMDVSQNDDGDIIKIQETDFVDGYFWRTNLRGSAVRSMVSLTILLPIVLSAAVALYAGLSGRASAVGAGFAALGAATPAAMIIVGCYPFYRANRKAYENDSTIIGESSVEEYAGVSVISFDDVNVFPSYGVKVRNVRLFNNCRIDKVLYYAASVFSATGGPLCDVFDVATMEIGHSDDVQILETGTGYVEATVNGRNIVFGRASALAALGIVIPEDVVVETGDIPTDCSVMYMIYQRKLVAKMIVNYVIDSDFEYLLRQLSQSGLCVCVKTFDPNIDEEMISRQIKAGGKYSLRVIKYRNTEEITKYTKRAEGGIVSRAGTKPLLNTVSSCDKILSAMRTGYVVGSLAVLVSALIMVVVLLAGSFSSMYSLYLALCQLFWLVPVLIATKLIVR